jgi:hypothetical protein
VLVESLFLLLDALEADPLAPAVQDILTAFDPAQARQAMTLIVMANFPDGEGGLAELSDGTVLCLAGLAHAAGDSAEAIDLLGRAEPSRALPRFMVPSHALRCRIAGIATGIETLLPPIGTPLPDLEGARERIAADPLDIGAHRAKMRHLAINGDLTAATGALFQALALPIEEKAKMGLAEDLPAFAAYAAARGNQSLFADAKARLALAAVPTITAHARVL